MNLRTAVLAWVFLGLIGSLAATVAVRATVRGGYPTAVAAIGGCAFCYGLIAPLIKIVRGNVSPRVEVDGTGTTFRPDRGIDISVQVSIAGLVVASALIAVLAPLGRLDVPVPPVMRHSLLPASCVIVAFGVPVLWRFVRRGSSRYLRLTPGGFELAQRWRPVSVDWHQVADISDRAPGQHQSTLGAVVFVLSDGNFAMLPAQAMTPNGSALRQLIRFYWTHPESRDELTDGRARTRLAQMQL
ncbi:hypothetical protein [Mycobacterium sp. 3519A]|uniref:hypothetical protein n=1 Tax=Mycobacterium sp. 3519A TaxID=2057184 RepID=UPI000C7A9D74|nr:hypothetical protein [Mycobacterium sp. 3519A]